MSIDESFGTATAAEVKLLLDDGGSRWVEQGPDRIAFGALLMRSWQVVPVQCRPELFGDRPAYLVKINYDLMLEPGVPSPAWFEVGLALSAPEIEEKVTVVDAIPRHVGAPQEPKSYDLDDHLAFVPGQRVHLPETRPAVYLFGLGGPEVRWRHAATRDTEVQPGSYTAWVTLSVPARCTRLAVDATARFDLAGSDMRLWSPAVESASVVLTLQAPESGADPIRPARGLDPVVPDPWRPRVFVSYAHDNHDHRESVLRFAIFLADECGFDVHLDRWDVDRRRDWYQWAIEQVDKADYVLVIASPRCREVGDGQVGNHENRGLQSELSLLRERLHSDRATWLRKLLPVVLPGRSIAEIPFFLQPNAADHYLVTDFTRDGAEDLLRVITGQPADQRPQPNPVIVSFAPGGPPVNRAPDGFRSGREFSGPETPLDQ